MPLTIVRNDIVKVKADAVVNSANPHPVFVTGTDRAIYLAAGSEKLLAEREKIGDIAPGKARHTPAFGLNADYIIHTVGPVWEGGNAGEFEALSSCYRESLLLARKLHCKSIAFPLISTGTYGFPKDKALSIAIQTISSFLMENEMKVILAVFDPESFVLGGKVFEDVREIVEDNYVRIHTRYEYDAAVKAAAEPGKASDKSMEDTFSDRLFRIINERGLKYSSVYKKANMNRQHFSKINCDPDYIPKKNTVMALCLALELSLSDAEDLMERAGYAFSPTIALDRVIKYFIIKEKYDIWEINAYLLSQDLPQLSPK